MKDMKKTSPSFRQANYAASEDVAMLPVLYKNQVIYEQQFYQSKSPDTLWYLAYDTQPLQPDFPLHIHSFTEIYMLIAGEVDYLVNTEIYHLQPGDIMIIPINCPHQTIVHQPGLPYERINLWIKPKALEKLSSNAPDLSGCLNMDVISPNHLIPCATRENEVIRTAIEQLAILQNEKKFAGDILAEGFLRQIVVYAYEYCRTDMSRPPQDRVLRNNLITSAIDEISRHLAEPITLESIASSLFVSKYHLAHTFKQYMGVSVHQFVINRRLAKAREMVNAGFPLKNVSAECGFSNYSNFYKIFRTHVGMSPTEYRTAGKKHAGKKHAEKKHAEKGKAP